jgi:hypothetical protein
MIHQRHQWGGPSRFPHKTERQCNKCKLVKVTRHEVDRTREVFWIEFWRGLDQVEGEKTPVCEEFA